MILTYHQIGSKIKDLNTVHYFTFILHLCILKLFNIKVVFLNEYDENNKKLCVLRFDDVDKKTLKYAIPILKIFGYPAEFFVVSGFVSSNNNYWADVDDLRAISGIGRLQYHSKSHKDLTEIDEIQAIEEEIKTPEWLKNINSEGFNYFAYPYWKYDDRIINCIQKYYKGALSGNGFENNTVWAMKSIKVLNDIKTFKMIYREVFQC